MGDVQYTNQLRQSMATLSGSSFQALPAMTLLVTKSIGRKRIVTQARKRITTDDTQLQVRLARRANS